MPSSRRPVLVLKGLRVFAGDKEVVHGVDLTVRAGELHAIMGPNGAGKSSLVHALMGHPGISISSGDVRFLGQDLLPLKPHERAQAGLFLAFQHPREILGVSIGNFLFAAVGASARSRSNGQAQKVTPLEFHDRLARATTLLQIDPAWQERPLHHGFSGGEKKKLELLQMFVLEPKLALLDETDSGLDLDALRVVAEGVKKLRKRRKSFAAVLVTHNTRFLKVLRPDRVHVMIGGRIVESGGAELARKLERKGFSGFRTKGS